jgi:hypothetical protein
MPREYRLAVFGQLVIALALVWATVGAFSFSRIIHYLGWGSMDVERQLVMFGGLSLLASVILALSLLGVLQMFQRRSAFGPSRKKG